MTINLIGYSHEATNIIMSSRTPSGFTVVRSASSRIEGVDQRNFPNCKTSKNVVVIMLMADPKSINVFSMTILFTMTVTTKASGFVYFAIRD